MTFRPRKKMASETLRQIDTEIATHEAAIYALKIRRNSSIAISQLPSELLALIFCLVRDDAFKGGVRCRGLHWIAPSMVCRTWRNIALSCPLLWNSIDISMNTAALEMFERSRSTPLDLRCSGHNMHRPALSSHYITHLARIRTIHFRDLVSVEPLGSLALDIDTPATELRSLYLSCAASVTLPPSPCLDRRMPVLTDLYIHNVPLSSPPLRLSSTLVNLTLSADDNSAIVFRFLEVLHLLASTPNLRKLCLRSIVDALSPDDDGSGIQPIDLPHLLKTKVLLLETSHFTPWLWLARIQRWQLHTSVDQD